MTSASLSHFSDRLTDGSVESLLARLRAGEPRAVAEAYDYFHAPARRLARRIVGDDAVAEDLLQEAFLALPAAMRRYDGRASISTFVLATVMNLARKYVRAAARRRRAHERAGETTPQSSAPDPEREATRRQLAALLWSALDQLGFEQREAFVLCEIEGRPSSEAATLVGVPDATLRARLLRARRNLKLVLARRGYP